MHTLYLNIMDALLVFLGVFCFPVTFGQETTSHANITNSTKDMYVIHATVYQIGIITNKSDEEVANMTGNQESLTFYHNNGTAMDLSAIPAPLMTNVTAQSIVGVAPTQDESSGANLPWAALVTPKENTPAEKSDVSLQSDNEENYRGNRKYDTAADLPYMKLFRRSLKSNESDAGPSIKVVKETALIPPAAGLQSIGLPSLLGLNSSLDTVPVPIPNTSIVRYAKVNTLVQSP
ncbi:hypothetical protein MSG28_001012 [Choristoneura fumiferana]|uniref:Uncharacterized protein n=1 Tax=Choristoneura fumiferana TaxID=7141 RepID=A0ACC0K3B8_CHOFU|nr:hypothetical protein MSG28_001012 [Choristoneura fumiferana]